MDFFLTAQELRQYGDAIQAVPWLGGDHDLTQKYPVVPFEEYLVVRHCTQKSVVEWIISDPDQALPLVQSWLFFGVIESALIDSYSSAAHLKETPNGLVIDTAFLRALQISWELRLSGAGMPISQWCKRWRNTFLRAEAVLLQLGWMAREPREGVPLPESTETALDHIVRLSLLLLEHLMLITPPELQHGPGLPTLMSLRTRGMEEELRGKLLSQGWCPSMYNTLQKISGSLHFVEYACCFPVTDGPADKHERCSEESCIAYNLDPATAQAKHRLPGCQCAGVAPCLEQIIQATSGDSFPVIDMRSLLAAHSTHISNFERATLRERAVSEYREGMKFVAISHVWSDGLMGTSETGLPHCQIQHLANLALTSMEICADSVSEDTPVFLWIDALCIPAESSVRKQAITKMRKVYSEACMTIVLDDGMFQSKDDRIGHTIMFRFMTCAWSRRLWTLQEAILSRNLYILFSEGLMQLSLLFEDVRAGTSVPMTEDALAQLAKLSRIPVEEVRRLDEICRTRPSDSIQGLILRELRSLPFLTQMDLRISQVAQMLSLRDSSKREDELLAISPLLRGDVSRLVHRSSEDRAKEFWLQLGAVPKDVVLLEYPKLSIPGFRCLPKTMLGQKVHMTMQWKYEDVQITDKGLRGKYWIYRWPEDCHPGFRKLPVHGAGAIVDREARQVIEFSADVHETGRDAAEVDAILLLDQPLDYSEVRNRPFRGLSLCSTASFHEGCEIFSPGRLLRCRVVAPLTYWDIYQGGLVVAGRSAEIIVG